MLAISSQSGESREGGLIVPDGRFPLDVEVGNVMRGLRFCVFAVVRSSGDGWN